MTADITIISNEKSINYENNERTGRKGVRLTQEMPQDTTSAIHIFRETQEIGAYVKYSYEALRAIEEIAVRRCLGVSTALREGVITIQIQEQDLRIWIKIE